MVVVAAAVDVVHSIPRTDAMNVVKQGIMPMTVQDTEVEEVEGIQGHAAGQGLAVREVILAVVQGAVTVVVEAVVVAETEAVTDMEAVTVPAGIDRSVVPHQDHVPEVNQETATNPTAVSSDHHISFHINIASSYCSMHRNLWMLLRCAHAHSGFLCVQIQNMLCILLYWQLSDQSSTVKLSSRISQIF